MLPSPSQQQHLPYRISCVHSFPLYSSLFAKNLETPSFFWGHAESTIKATYSTSEWMTSKMPVKFPQHVPFFKIIFFAWHVVCPPPFELSTFLPLTAISPLSPPLTLGQLVQPFTNSSLSCQATCTLVASVRRDSLLYFWR